MTVLLNHHINLTVILRPRQYGWYFADNIFKCIFFNENCCVLIKMSLKYICKGPIDNNPSLVQIMAWRRTGDKPLSEAMIAQFGDACIQLDVILRLYSFSIVMCNVPCKLFVKQPFVCDCRDTTVQTLTLQPSVHDGVIVYEDSPLVSSLMA